MLHIRRYRFRTRTCCLCRAFILQLQLPLSRLMISLSLIFFKRRKTSAFKKAYSSILIIGSPDNFLSAVPSDSAGEMF
jgi:hypothetical protein